MLRKEDIIEINKQFDKGNVVNESSSEFALSQVSFTKNWLKQAAYLTRAVLIDHVFEEGNKRTVAAIIMAYFETHRLAYDIYKVDKAVIEILKKNIIQISTIMRLIKNAIR